MRSNFKQVGTFVEGFFHHSILKKERKIKHKNKEFTELILSDTAKQPSVTILWTLCNI